MILISHRGNINGKTGSENDPQYVYDAMKKGYHVEVDIWYIDNQLYLGHDKPQYNIQAPFLGNEQIWCHCKNLDAVVRLKEINEKYAYDIHYFWHQKDDITMTSKGYIWAYPGKQIINGSIAVLPEIHDEDVSKCIGVCSDYIERYK